MIQRGSILDRNDQVLAETVPQSETLARRYPFIAAAPIVGYYSINYGAAGVEEALDRVLRGPRAAVDQLLHRRQSGQSVRTTLDSSAQQILSDRLTQPGAAVVLSLPDGAVTALASSPSFDPNALDQNWKTLSADPAAPLLNRATQGLYQPGAIFETLLLADAIERGLPLTKTLTQPDRPITLDRLTLTCGREDASPATLAEAYAQACPAPFADLAAQLTSSDLISLTQKWKLDVPPALEIRTSAALTPTVRSQYDAGFAVVRVGAGRVDALTAAHGAGGGHHRQQRLHAVDLCGEGCAVARWLMAALCQLCAVARAHHRSGGGTRGIASHARAGPQCGTWRYSGQRRSTTRVVHRPGSGRSAQVRHRGACWKMPPRRRMRKTSVVACWRS